MSQVYALIMAGGVGSRFWPRSRKSHPKQLLNILGEQTMLHDTLERLRTLVDLSHTFIVTNRVQAALIQELMPEFPTANLLIEPQGRNTAPCIGLGTLHIAAQDPEAVIFTLPADHFIAPEVDFIGDLKRAQSFARQQPALLTFGISPNRPETGYGYIHFDPQPTQEGIHKVNRFVEKPNLEKAQEYLDSGEYDWNSGMFCWSVQSIFEAFKTHCPELYAGLEQLKVYLNTPNYEQKLPEIYATLPAISIDYAVMEKSEQVYKVDTHFQWNDVGHWESLYEQSPKDENGNALQGDIWTHKASQNYGHSPHKFTALIGVENLVVVDTPDALLVCDREHAQDVKYVVDYLKEEKRLELT